MSKQKYTEIDVLYAIGTLLVIAGHSHSSNWETFRGTILETILDVIYAFHMPLFFFIAGFLFLNSTKLLKIGYGAWVKEKAIKLLTPYVVLTIFGGIPKYFVEYRTFSGVGIELMQSLVKPRLNIWGHFWFIPVLFFMYVLFGIIRIKIKSKQLGLLLSAVFAVVCSFLPINSMWFGIKDIHDMAIFFVIGMVFQYFHMKDKTIPGFLRLMIMLFSIAGAGTLLQSRLYAIGIVRIVCSVFLIVACWEFAFLIRKNSVASWLSVHNFTIYIYSWMFQSVLMMLCDNLGMVWYFETIAMFFIGITGPVILIEVYDHIPGIHCGMFDLILGVKGNGKTDK